MVSKASSTIQAAKLKKLADRKERSLFVKIKGTTTAPLMEKSNMEGIIKGIHPGIERVYFPRQSRPRFFYALCKDTKTKEAASKAIAKFKGQGFERLTPKKVNKNVEPEDSVIKTSKSEDLLTLVLEAIPKSLETDTIKAEFPSCKRIYRFNDKRCYIYFKTVPDAFAALQKVKSEAICGFKMTAKYNKMQKIANQPNNDNKVRKKNPKVPKLKNTK